MATVHTYPENDLVEHVLVGDECPCGPEVRLVPSPGGGPDGWQVIHCSLDRREDRE